MKVVLAFLANTLCNFAIGLLVAKFLGPEEFGRFALALAIGAALQTLLFEWIRLSAVRFYSQRSRTERPDLRPTLDFAFLVFAAGVALAAAIALFAGASFPLPSALIGLAVAASIANGLFDFTTALARARFDDGLYGRLVLTKNFAALLLTAGGALIFHSAAMALTGVAASMAGSIALFWRSLAEDRPRGVRPSAAVARECAAYAAPIVVGNLLIYALLPLFNRALMARWHGYAETGQFSLANDIGTRMVLSISSSLDVLLFQLAVRADDQHGGHHGRDQIARNMGVIFAIVLPACAGVWLTLPSIERLVVPEEFRGPFLAYFSLLLPGQFAFGMFAFAVVPHFLIAKKTLPMILAAALACLADVALIRFLPPEPHSIALAQTGAMIVGLSVLTVNAAFTGARFPPARDIAAAIAGGVAMVAALLPLRGATPGAPLLAAQVVLGVAVYGAFVAVLDTAGLRGVALDVARSLRARLAQA